MSLKQCKITEAARPGTWRRVLLGMGQKTLRKHGADALIAYPKA